MSTRKLVNNLPILNRTLSHWSQVENLLGEAVTLPKGTTRDVAQDLATSIQGAETALTVARNTLSSAQGERDAARKVVYPEAKQARKSLRGLAKNVPEVLGLPELLPITSAPAVLLTSLDDIANIWERVNALPQTSVPAAKLPLRIPLLENGVVVYITLAQFQTHTTALRTAAQNLAEAEDSVMVGIGTRDGLHTQAAEVVKSYASTVIGLIPDGHPLLNTLPRLTS